MTMSPLDVLPQWRRLSVRVVGFLLLTLLIGLTAIGATLYLSWQLEGGAAAINAAGSLRKQTYRLALSLEEYTAAPDPALRLRIVNDLGVFEHTLTQLKNGDPTRPLYLPHDETVHLAFDRIRAHYQAEILPPAQAVLAGRNGPARADLRVRADDFVGQIDGLVTLVEHYNERRTLLLQASQVMLIAMAIAGCTAQIYLMFLLIFRPLERLSEGMRRMASRDLSVRLPVETRDEFGALTQGFNHMADRLSDSYATLEARVQDKTAILNEQNRELSLLYGITAWLNENFDAQELCQGFVEHLRTWFGAAAASVRVTDPAGQQAHLLAADRLPDVLIDAPECRQIDDCLCGQVVRSNGAVIKDFRMGVPEGFPASCTRLGFAQVSAFPVRARQQQTGFFTLHFQTPHAFSPREMQLLDSLGNHLGNALESLRLAASERELAVTQERNLLAQGLHDSIAQGLSFLNLQVQMLDDALKRSALDEARTIVPLLHTGVQESYDDVRDLLHNFRARLDENDLRSALEAAVGKFRRQTGLHVDFTATGHGLPLPTDLQIQVLFILQEALSNVRKHAQGADRVEVHYAEGPMLSLVIRDNGPGLDPARMAERSERHVGLRIMHERAARLGATLTIESGPGVTVSLSRPEPSRGAMPRNDHD
ncbi:type IV pili methyl-accepting chemotaxis transducer N-terminal domain-containing protein [Paludibacterium purpuratum]|uniref:Sensor protein n=1 Tax=Paludibacterium purpuratum TaxID=1144873 RepID=A0A4R7B507_9NEIS|nr:type IV pili methyl-accepting chemotaxis transducer N-terminal domain-containing protein [Paludibacterium purpuratum]TDR79688.1 two-component system nitrate/nitrite sensor histidine kinase NarX [Paludibacterium purpuratum]